MFRTYLYHWLCNFKPRVRLSKWWKLLKTYIDFWLRRSIQKGWKRVKSETSDERFVCVRYMWWCGLSVWATKSKKYMWFVGMRCICSLSSPDDNLAEGWVSSQYRPSDTARAQFGTHVVYSTLAVRWTLIYLIPHLSPKREGRIMWTKDRI